MKKLGRNKDDQKRSNWGTILRLLATRQCSSRIELAKATGLTKTAISQIVGDMLEQGIIEEAEKEVRMESGRNPVRLVISPKAPKFIGILIDRNSCAAVLCDMNLQVLKRDVIEKEWMDREDLMEHIFLLVDSMLAQGYPVIAIGAASIGPVNITEGKIVNPYYFHGIHDVEVRRILEDRYNLPVYFDHDNQSAALAEFLFGNGSGYQDILLIGIGRGVGSGIMVQGHRIHSTYGYAPEIGHISLDYQGEQCICGNHGCLELYVNSDQMMRKFRQITGRDLVYEEYMKLTDQPEIEAVMQECIQRVTAGIVSTLNVLNSQIVLLALHCCYWPERYIQQIEREINRIKFGNKNVDIPVKKVHFLMDTQLLGSACNAMNWIFNGEVSRVNKVGGKYFLVRDPLPEFNI